MRVSAFLLASLLTFAAVPGLAQRTSATDERARELYLLGDDLYSQGRYEEALAAFEEAYRLSERPLLLFNIANAQERSGQWQGAIESLERYLPHADEAERSRIESRIESLRRRVERLEAMQQVPDEPDEPDVTPAETPEEPSRSLAGPLVLATGGALLAGGVVSAILAKGARDSLEADCTVTDGRRLCPDSSASDRDRNLRASVFADVLFVASAAAVGVGLWLLLRDDDDDDDDDAPDPEPTVDVSAAVGRDAAALVLRGRF